MTKLTAQIEQLRQAVERLVEALAAPKDILLRDSAILRFLLVFDLAWKTLKEALEEQGVICASPGDCFREAYRLGIIDYSAFWGEVIKMRNAVAHAYREQLAEEVYQRLPEALRHFQELLAKLAKTE